VQLNVEFQIATLREAATSQCPPTPQLAYAMWSIRVSCNAIIYLQSYDASKHLS